MTRSLLLVLGLLLPACGGGNSAVTQPATQTGLNDRDALAKLEVEVAKPLPEIWKDSTVAFIADPVTMCNGTDIEEHVKNEDTVQLEKAKAALQDAGITVQESTDQATVVFSIRILANCSGGGRPLVTGDVSAMPGNGAVAAKSDLFEVTRFDAGKVTLALLRNEILVGRMQSK
ncbi:MAG TPA: hypothetical protein PK156_19405 [Polyangium sp.]|nr:hypothetical protein [Polyangium sp.]